MNDIKKIFQEKIIKRDLTPTEKDLKNNISKTIEILDTSAKQGRVSGLTRMKTSGEKSLENRLKRGIFQKGTHTGKTAFPEDNKTGFENNFVDGVFQNETQEQLEEDRKATPEDIAKKELDLSEKIIEVNKNHIAASKQQYRDLEKKKINILESIDSGAWRIGAGLAGNMAKEVSDVVSLSEQIATGSFMIAATGGIGLGTSSIAKPVISSGLAKWGAYLSTKGLQHVADAAVGVYDDAERQKFFGFETPNKEEMGMQFASGLAVSVLGDTVLHGAGKLLNKYIDNLSVWDVGGIPLDSTGNLRSVRDVAIEAFNADSGVPHYHETRAFLKGLSKDTAIDPRNPHMTGTDAMMDLVDPDKMYISGDAHRVVEPRSRQLDDIEINKSKMSIDDYEVQKSIATEKVKRNLKQDLEVDNDTEIIKTKELPIDEQLAKIDTEIPEHSNIKKDILLKNQGINQAGEAEVTFTEMSNYDKTLNTLKKHAKTGSFAVFSDGDTSISITKEANGNITKTTIKNDKIKWSNRNDPKARTKTYQENLLNNIVKFARIEVIQPDGKIKTVTGTQKMFYHFASINKQKMKEVADVLIKQSERQQSLVNQAGYKKSVLGLGKTKSSLESKNNANILYSQIRGARESITGTTASLFEDTLGLKYDSIDKFVYDCENGLGLSIVKNEPMINFRKTAESSTKLEAAGKFINHLVDQDSFTQSLQNKLGNELEIYPQEFPEIFVEKDGILDFNREGLFKDGVEDTILDLATNPNMIDTPEYFTKYGENIPDSHILNKVILPHIGYERINGMAMEKVFQTPKHNNILKQVGMLMEDDIQGVNITSPKEVLDGLAILMNDYISEKPIYDKGTVKDIFDGFADFSKLPQRFDIPRDRTADVGPVSTNLYDFIFSNRSANIMPKTEINQSLAPITSMLKDEVKNATNILVRESKKGLEGTQISKAKISVAKDTNVILNRIKKLLEGSKTNEYLSGDRFRKDKKELINLKGFLDIDNENLVDYKKILDLEPKVYEGPITSENLTPFLKENLNIKALDIEGEKNLVGILDNWNEKLTGKYVKKHVTTKKFAKSKDELVNLLKAIDADKELVSRLEKLNPAEYTKSDKQIYLNSIKEAKDHISSISKKSKDLKFYLDALTSDLEKGDVEKTIKYKRFLKKANQVLDNAPESEAKRQFKDFMDFKNNQGEYNISAKDLTDNINKAIKELSMVSGEASQKELSKRAKKYREIGKLYGKLGNSLRETKTDNTIKFFSNSDIKDTYSKIIELNKELGGEFKSLEPLVNIMDSVKNITDRFAESKANSPLQRRQKNFAIKSPRLTSDQTKKIKRAEIIMNKKRLLADKELFEKTPEEIVKVIHKYESVQDITDALKSGEIAEGDIVKNFVKDKYLKDFEDAYEFAAPLIDTVPDTLEDGTVVFRDINKDEFALAYAQILDEVTKTTQIMNKVNIKDYKNLSEVNTYFKDFDKFLDFLCKRDDYNRPKNEIIYNLIDKNANILAEYSVLGKSLSSFSNNIDVSNASMKDILNLNKVSSVIDGKVVTKEFPTALDGNMKALQARLQTIALPRSNAWENKYLRDSGVAKMAHTSFDIATAAYMIATGLKEITAKPFIVNSRINKLEDYLGQSGAFSRKQFTALATGLKEGTFGTGEVAAKCLIGTWNTVSELDRWFGIQRLLNKTANLDLDLRIKKNMDVDMWFDIPKTKKDKLIKTALNRYNLNEKFRKVKDVTLSDPSDEFTGIGEYAKEGLSSAFKESHTQINTAQELASSIAYSNAAAASLGQLDLINTRAYDQLSGNQLHYLRLMGINENNFDLFKKTYSKFTDGDGILADLDEINISDYDLNFSEILMIDKIKGVYHAIRNKGFDENKDAKFSQNALGDAWHVIMSKFKRTTVGAGMEDVSDFLYQTTKYGTIESRYSANIKNRNLTDTGKYLGQFAKALGGGMLVFTAAGEAGNIANRFAKGDLRQTRKEAAKIIGDAEAIKNAAKDKDYKKMLQITSNTFFTNLYENSTAGVFFSEGNILNSLGSSVKQVIIDTNTIAMKQGKSREEIDDFWSALGLSGMTEDIGYLDAPENKYKLLAIGHTLLKMSHLKYAINLSDSYKYAKGDYNEAQERKTFDKYHADRLTKYERNKAFEGLTTQPTLESVRPKDLTKEEKKEMTDLIEDPNTLFESVSIMLKNMGILKRDQADIYSTGLNESLHAHGFKDDDEYKSDKVQILKEMDFDKTISELPMIYRLAIGNILDDYVPKDELDLLETKKEILRDVSNDMNIRDLKNKYVSENKKRKVSTLPIIYRMLEDDLKEKGFNVKQGEMLKYAQDGLNIKNIREIYEEKQKASKPNISVEDLDMSDLNKINAELDLDQQEKTPQDILTGIKDQDIDIDIENSKIEQELKKPIQEEEPSKLEKLTKETKEQLKENIDLNLESGKRIVSDAKTGIKNFKNDAKSLLKQAEILKDKNKDITKEQLLDLFNNIQKLSETADTLDTISEKPKEVEEIPETKIPETEFSFDKIKNTVGDLLEVAKDGIRDFEENATALAERTGDSTKESFETAKKMTELTLEEVEKSTDTFTPDDAEPVFEINIDDVNNMLSDIVSKSKAITGSLDDILTTFDIPTGEVKESSTITQDDTIDVQKEIKDELKQEQSNIIEKSKEQVELDDKERKDKIKKAELEKAQKEVSKVLRKRSNVVPDVIANKVLDRNTLPPLVASMLREKEVHHTKSGDERVMYYHRKAGTKHANANTSWCAAFVTSMLMENGFKFKPNEKTSVAQQVYRYRDKVRKNADEAQVGDVVIFRNRTAHRTKRSWSGHVNVIAAVGKDYIMCIGGNQDSGQGAERHSTINFKVYSKSRASKAMNQRDLPTPDMSIIKVRDMKK